MHSYEQFNKELFDKLTFYESAILKYEEEINNTN